ncbi:thiazole tautomerase (transcriptional regulator TenI) [Oikeobacillus pervagus]|uniref:Thiazole tautomerase (Transcriptional regulator TenI) n=1 Tax=Oikeobacillus pervagus TaxID=1325931 RepID=A0AAJ1SZ61_9BACI|nr:thiamine phosphate synthase [Oikeobacillus pervagus]MDQ0215498.1 thiazole tautomerase (transcriptional regulator TenI) [Oikeobacillus pervagus]
MYKIHAITNDCLPFDRLVQIILDIQSEVDLIQIREKRLTEQELMKLVQYLIKSGVCKEKLVINTHYEIAVNYGLAGVHLPENSRHATAIKKAYPHLIVGRSIHSLSSAIQAEEDHVDYMFFGHIFPTASKKNVAARGVESLREIVQHVHTPVIAIGGITPQNVERVIRTNACGIAIMSGIFNEPNWKSKIRQYQLYGRKGE